MQISLLTKRLFYGRIKKADTKGQVLSMPSNNKPTRAGREAQIDNTSANLIIVILIAVLLMLVILASYLTITVIARSKSPEADQGQVDTNTDQGDHPFKVDGITVNMPKADENTLAIDSGSISSSNALLYDVTANEIVASRLGEELIYPASMTKVMSLIVIVENLKSENALNETFTVTQEMYDRKVAEGHSGDFKTVGETMTVKDAIYAFILDSDGMMGIGLAQYIAGSESVFVNLMNEKAKEMGLEKTNFLNCTGIHHSYHYTTCRDMATIMAYAMQNPLCAEVLSREAYKTTTSVYTSGITFYHDLLVTRFENHPVRLNTVEIVAGKTGWTGSASGYCVVSYAKGNNGHSYILVTAGAPQKFNEIDDLQTLYNQFAK